MSEGKIIAINADVKGVKIVHSRNVLQVILEVEKAHLKNKAMQQAHHDLVDCEAGDKTYRVMFMEVEMAEKTIDKVRAKQEAQYPDKPIVSEGFPWQIIKKVSFRNFLASTTEHNEYLTEEGFIPDRSKEVIKLMYKVDTTTKMEQGEIDEVIHDFNEWLRGDNNGK